MNRTWLFPGFFIGGFESSSQIHWQRGRINQQRATQHLEQAEADYALLLSRGIRAARDAIVWPAVAAPRGFDFAAVEPLVQASATHGVTVIWDLFHYGFPESLDPLSDAFVAAYADYCHAVARFLVSRLPTPRFYTPINEISYFAYAAGEIGYMGPFLRGRGEELKINLCRAALAGMAAIRSEDPTARFVHAEPLVHTVAPPDAPEMAAEVERFNHEVVYAVWDLLAGRRLPELGGSEAWLDLIALNFYWLGQWEYGRPGRFLAWGQDPRWVAPRLLFRQVWNRYRRPLLIGETGGYHEQRPAWLHYLFNEVQESMREGVDFQGFCWYPIITCPDWEDPTAFFGAGLWEAVPENGRLRRVLFLPLAHELERCRRALGEPPAPVEQAEEPVDSGQRPILRSVQVVATENLIRPAPDNFTRAPALTSETMAADVYTLGPGQTLTRHRYLASEVFLLGLRGTVRCVIGGTAVDLAAGELTWVPRGVDYDAANPNEEVAAFLQIASPRPWDADYQGPRPVDRLAWEEAPSGGPSAGAEGGCGGGAAGYGSVRGTKTRAAGSAALARNRCP